MPKSEGKKRKETKAHVKKKLLGLEKDYYCPRNPQVPELSAKEKAREEADLRKIKTKKQ